MITGRARRRGHRRGGRFRWRRRRCRRPLHAADPVCHLRTRTRGAACLIDPAPRFPECTAVIRAKVPNIAGVKVTASLRACSGVRGRMRRQALARNAIVLVKRPVIGAGCGLRLEDGQRCRQTHCNPSRSAVHRSLLEYCRIRSRSPVEPLHLYYPISGFCGKCAAPTPAKFADLLGLQCSACVPRSSKLKPRKLFLANIIIRPTIRDGPTDGGEPLVV